MEEQSEEIHVGYICDVCDDDEYIIGPRFKCDDCEVSYDLCLFHYSLRKEHHISNHFFRRKRAKKKYTRKRDEEIHYGTICDVCDDNRSILGPRYKCRACTTSYDLCQNHFEERKQHHDGNHSFKRMKIDKNVRRTTEELHPRIICDVCDNKKSIRGPRYQCRDCGRSYDLCQRHFDEREKHHDPDHKFMRRKARPFSKHPVDKDDELIGKKLNSFSEIPCSSAVHNELLRSLETLLVTYGPSRSEEKILDFITKEVRKAEDFDQLVMVRDMRFGVFVIVPSLQSSKKGKKKEERTVLMDAHVDTWKEQYIEPVVFESRIKKSTKYIAKSTGLDNRIHVAILLELVKRVRFENTRFVVLFSVQEEIGMRGTRYFSRKVDLKKYGITSLDLVLVLDVCDGDLQHNTVKPKKKIVRVDPTIGAGFCPLKQNWGPEDHETGDLGVTECCNTRGFVYGMCKKVFKSRLCCPCCYMHEFSSYASVSDMFDLYDYISENIEEIIRDGDQQKAKKEEEKSDDEEEEDF